MPDIISITITTQNPFPSWRLIVQKLGLLLPYNSNNVIIRSHDKDLARRRATFNREMWDVKIRGKGLGINLLTQEIGFRFTARRRKIREEESLP